MPQVPAKLSIKGKRYEILVDVDGAIKVKQGKLVSMANVIISDCVFSDLKKGLRVAEKDLIADFGTSEISAIAERIIKNGEVNIPAEYRDAERENRIKQIVDFLVRNAMNPVTNKPYTPDMIKSSLDRTGVNIDNRPVEEQISKILEKLRPILPIRIETKKLSIKVPAVHTGKVYGLITEYKEKEEWLNNGDLAVVINLPAGMQMGFYDKLNAVTHGSAVVEEIKQ
ncbi:MAG: ribosome assembly factor SBDS [Nanoarchaeota archaeon]|nr:ribosome assembly factor SBDS [Nanoarchaeota archaeon]MBU4086326.1 ribosome assembly factor SBDS [Nanoarchaeota archaeon]